MVSISLDELIHKRLRLKKLTKLIGQEESFIYIEPLSKRFFDVFLSVVGLILSTWLWILIIILIVLEDGFPVLIRQRRIGKDGKIFNSFKFRTMVKSSLKDKVSNQAIEHDPRVTRVGSKLRSCALDELPQLLNILIGEMSFVGPRPLLLNEVETNSDPEIINIETIPGYEKRLIMRPGLTGIAQIFVARDIPRKHKFKYDFLYIKKMSFFYDLQLIVLSILISIKGAWEKRGIKLPILRRHE